MFFFFLIGSWFHYIILPWFLRLSMVAAMSSGVSSFSMSPCPSPRSLTLSILSFSCLVGMRSSNLFSVVLFIFPGISVLGTFLITCSSRFITCPFWKPVPLSHAFVPDHIVACQSAIHCSILISFTSIRVSWSATYSIAGAWSLFCRPPPSVSLAYFHRTILHCISSNFSNLPSLTLRSLFQHSLSILLPSYMVNE